MAVTALGYLGVHSDRHGGRQRLRDMRLEAAAQGGRVPPVAACPWLYGGLAKQR